MDSPIAWREILSTKPHGPAGMCTVTAFETFGLANNKPSTRARVTLVPLLTEQVCWIGPAVKRGLS